MAERQSWHTYIPYTDRIHYLGGVLNNFPYVLAVGQLAGIQAPQRAQVIRIMTSELQVNGHFRDRIAYDRVVDENQGFFSFSQPCPRCGGQGYLVEDPCPTCRGSGVERRPREVKVRIPPGVADGQRIRLKGRGGPGRNGGPPGDLYVTVRVGSHPIFGRRGRDLTITVPITFPEAALGADVRVPTLDGGTVTLRIPPGTRSGRTFRVRGRGVPTTKGTGDLLVTVEVAVPQRLTDEERKAVEALAAATDGRSPRAHLGVE